MFRTSFTIFAPFALLLAACNSGPSISMPVPDPSDSPSASALGIEIDHDWLVAGQNDYLTASGPVCSWEDILTDPKPEYFGVHLEVSPGLPDESGQYEVDSNGILLAFDTGKYQVSRFEGDVTAGIGTVWETFGTFTFQRDAHGVVSGGSGSGSTRIIRENGDVEHSTDTLTFAVTPFDDETWCDLPQ